jgi:hypothetical protein
MSDGYGVTAGPLTTTATQWDGLEELMTTSQGELAGASSGGFPPSVQGAAATFLAAWAGYAGESSTIASGFADALRSTQTLYGQGDRMSEAELRRLDGRLGPAR